MRASLIAVAGFCLLAACGAKPGGNAAAGGGGPAGSGGAPAPSGPDQVLNLSDLPHPRAGQWQETSDDGDGKPTTQTVCLSGAVPSVKIPPSCSQYSLKRTILGAYVMDMTCAEPQFTLVSHTQMTGDFQSSMVGDMTMTITVPGQAPQTTKTHSDSRYLGPCAPGQTPDDAGAGDSNATG